jgi:hypothetical protein
MPARRSSPYLVKGWFGRRSQAATGPAEWRLAWAGAWFPRVASGSQHRLGPVKLPQPGSVLAQPGGAAAGIRPHARPSHQMPMLGQMPVTVGQPGLTEDRDSDSMTEGHARAMLYASDWLCRPAQASAKRHPGPPSCLVKAPFMGRTRFACYSTLPLDQDGEARVDPDITGTGPHLRLPSLRPMPPVPPGPLPRGDVCEFSFKPPMKSRQKYTF